MTFCNRLVLVTDLYRFNHDRLRLFLEKYHRPAVPITLLLRNNMDTTLSLERIINYIDISIDKNEVFIIYRNDLDYINSLLCHYNSSYNFIRISRQLQKYLKAEIFHLYPQIKIRYRHAYRIAKELNEIVLSPYLDKLGTAIYWRYP